MFVLFVILQREHDAAMLWGKLACIGQQVVQDGFHFKDVHTSINVLSISIENKIQLLALYILSIRIEDAAREFYELYFGRNEGLLYLFSVLIRFNSEMDKRTQFLAFSYINSNNAFFSFSVSSLNSLLEGAIMRLRGDLNSWAMFVKNLF